MLKMKNSPSKYVFNINPVPASRPRLSRYGAFFTGPYKKFRTEATPIILKVIGNEIIFPLDHLIVTIELCVVRPKKTVLLYPRADVDNYAKSILDLMNGKLWKDDQQVVMLEVSKQWSTYDVGYFTVQVSPVLS
jgi:Holliday junction resolvase RusA-like endonuclease